MRLDVSLSDRVMAEQASIVLVSVVHRTVLAQLATPREEILTDASPKITLHENTIRLFMMAASYN